MVTISALFLTNFFTIHYVHLKLQTGQLKNASLPKIVTLCDDRMRCSGVPSRASIALQTDRLKAHCIGASCSASFCTGSLSLSIQVVVHCKSAAHAATMQQRRRGTKYTFFSLQKFPTYIICSYHTLSLKMISCVT